MNVLEYLLTTTTLLTCAHLYFRVADRFNIIDKPNERSSHTRVTIRGGGVLFYIGVILFYLLFGFNYSLFFAGLSLIAVISFIDDISALSSKYRIVVHFAAMLLMFADCGFYSIPWYYTVVALIIATGIINAYNFMDGINGITGGYSLVVMGSFWYINNYVEPFIHNQLLYVVAISLMVFDLFNFRVKARCFAGDVGSVSIAFIVVFLLGKLIVASGNFFYLALLMVYGVDSVLTIVYRLYLKENIFLAHRKHLYQLMANEYKIAHPVVSLIYMAAQSVISIIFISAPTPSAFLIIALTTGSIWVLIRNLKISTYKP